MPGAVQASAELECIAKYNNSVACDGNGRLQVTAGATEWRKEDGECMQRRCKHLNSDNEGKSALGRRRIVISEDVKSLAVMMIVMMMAAVVVVAVVELRRTKDNYGHYFKAKKTLMRMEKDDKCRDGASLTHGPRWSDEAPLGSVYLSRCAKYRNLHIRRFPTLFLRQTHPDYF
ncbi:hypothetical protein E2C01_047971 [Portunus trituberculatus]|uniref:Uncharacterized protein n=1 Tax=Portunus trituberculatus TaxID=210409 RepID=A0A5B7GBZ8_PORTR|nr:hypothetical protein [Portunus trituberculatus]